MGIRSWWAKLRKREDQEALERAEAMATETPEERYISEGDIEGMAADERTGRLAGEATIEDAERLGDGD
jgi:hypothetical protein